jgi:hypothetical protein
MKCPTCNEEMKKVRWEISNNFKMADQYKEYDKNTYECKADDIWVTVETPIIEQEDK